MSRIDWSGMIEFGLGRRRLPPEQFWSLSPREFLALRFACSDAAFNPIRRRDLAGLMADWPDEVNKGKTT